MKILNQMLISVEITLFVCYVLTGDIGPVLVGFATGFHFTIWLIDYLDRKYRKNDDS